MVSVLTENKITGYKSKILEASIRKDMDRKMVFIDSEAAHEQIQKQMRKRHMIKLKQSQINAYVQNQVRVITQRQNRKIEQEVAK